MAQDFDSWLKGIVEEEEIEDLDPVAFFKRVRSMVSTDPMQLLRLDAQAINDIWFTEPDEGGFNILPRGQVARIRNLPFQEGVFLNKSTLEVLADMDAAELQELAGMEDKRDKRDKDETDEGDSARVPSIYDLSASSHWRRGQNWLSYGPQVGVDGMTEAQWKDYRWQEIQKSLKGGSPNYDPTAFYENNLFTTIQNGEQGDAVPIANKKTLYRRPPSKAHPEGQWQTRKADGTFSSLTVVVDWEKIGMRLRQMLVENYDRLPIKTDTGTLRAALAAGDIDEPDVNAVRVTLANAQRPQHTSEFSRPPPGNDERPVSLVDVLAPFERTGANVRYYGPRVFQGRPAIRATGKNEFMRFMVNGHWIATKSVRASRTDLNAMELTPAQRNELGKMYEAEVMESLKRYLKEGAQ